jgi:hypothetical protein
MSNKDDKVDGFSIAIGIFLLILLAIFLKPVAQLASGDLSGGTIVGVLIVLGVGWFAYTTLRK